MQINYAINHPPSAIQRSRKAIDRGTIEQMEYFFKQHPQCGKSHIQTTTISQTTMMSLGIFRLQCFNQLIQCLLQVHADETGEKKKLSCDTQT